MRWKSPKVGDVDHWSMGGCLEVIAGFLFLPKTIAGETRWLERATWEQQYLGIWLDKRWVNK